MPRVKPTTIYFKQNKKADVLHPMEDVQSKEGLLIVLRMEVQNVPLPMGKMQNLLKQPPKMGQKQSLVPVKAYNLCDIERVDFGYMDPITFKEEMAKFKKEADLKGKLKGTPKAVVGAAGKMEKKELKPGEAYPGEFDAPLTAKEDDIVCEPEKDKK